MGAGYQQTVSARFRVFVAVYFGIRGTYPALQRTPAGVDFCL